MYQYVRDNMDKTEEIIKQIIKQKDAIIRQIKRESIDVYIFLQKEFNKGDILNNHVFQFLFRSYYRLDNAGLSDIQKIEFFKLMDGKEDGLAKILSKLYDIKTLNGKHTFQYSFATKLLHIIDKNKPIFDSHVKRALKLPNAKGENKQEKLQSYLQLYNDLQRNVQELLNSNQIMEMISELRNRFNVKKQQVSDVKALDFILWSYGNFVNKGD